MFITLLFANFQHFILLAFSGGSVRVKIILLSALSARFFFLHSPKLIILVCTPLFFIMLLLFASCLFKSHLFLINFSFLLLLRRVYWENSSNYWVFDHESVICERNYCVLVMQEQEKISHLTRRHSPVITIYISQ